MQNFPVLRNGKTHVAPLSSPNVGILVFFFDFYRKLSRQQKNPGRQKIQYLTGEKKSVKKFRSVKHLVTSNTFSHFLPTFFFNGKVLD